MYCLIKYNISYDKWQKKKRRILKLFYIGMRINSRERNKYLYKKIEY